MNASLRLVLLGCCATLPAFATVTTTSTEVHPLAAGGTVRVANVNGAIAIATWDRPEASVQIEKTADCAEVLETIEVKIQSTSDSLTIAVKRPKYELGWRDLLSWGHDNNNRVRLKLKVPVSARLEKITEVNGSISLTDTPGPVNASTVNGSIHATGLRGGALKSVNGSIQAGADHFDASAQLAVHTVNGSVVISLPKAAGATVHLATVNGRVSCQRPLADDAHISRHELTGLIGTGGGAIDVQTINGAIRLQNL